MTERNVIVGGGLSGLYAARLLAAAGMDFLLLEARERLGGRILSVAEDGFDLGPAWFWPDMQPMMARLVEELGLTAFAQYSDGDVLIERSAQEPVQRFAGFGQMASSFRIAGGTAALVSALAAGLPKDKIRLGVQVTQAELRDEGVTLRTRDADGKEDFACGDGACSSRCRRACWNAASLSRPRRQPVRSGGRRRPGWRRMPNSWRSMTGPSGASRACRGTAQSAVGPMVEIHDASAIAGQAALFGFVGVPAAARQQIGEALAGHCLRQLVRLFGPGGGRSRRHLFQGLGRRSPDRDGGRPRCFRRSSRGGRRALVRSGLGGAAPSWREAKPRPSIPAIWKARCWRRGRP